MYITHCATGSPNHPCSYFQRQLIKFSFFSCLPTFRIADFLKDRFNPSSPLGPEEVKKRANELREAIGKQVEDTTAATLFNKMVEAVESIYRTNLYMKDRYSLAFRIDPKLMLGPGETRTIPYGVFFVHGRRCNGFHVRFRDIARGGLRIVSPPTSEHIAIESSRQFDEAYGLAFAQQLKNKDIPEGGRSEKRVMSCFFSFF